MKLFVVAYGLSGKNCRVKETRASVIVTSDDKMQKMDFLVIFKGRYPDHDPKVEQEEVSDFARLGFAVEAVAFIRENLATVYAEVVERCGALW